MSIEITSHFFSCTMCINNFMRYKNENIRGRGDIGYIIEKSIYVLDFTILNIKLVFLRCITRNNIGFVFLSLQKCKLTSEFIYTYFATPDEKMYSTQMHLRRYKV